MSSSDRLCEHLGRASRRRPWRLGFLRHRQTAQPTRASRILSSDLERTLTLYVLGEDGKRDRSVPSVIGGTLGDADAVLERIRNLLRLGAHKASEVALVGDAAP